MMYSALRVICADKFFEDTFSEHELSITTTLLHVESLFGNSANVEFLIRKRADVNNVDSMGNTPLDLAIKARSYSTIDSLIRAGADVNMNRPDRFNNLEYAIETRNRIIVEKLISAGALMNGRDGFIPPLHMAVSNADAAMINLLLERRADVNEHDGSNTVLHKAISMGFTYTTSCLLKAPSISIDAKNRAGHTPLYYAYENRDYLLVEMLLSAGARFDSDYGIFDTQQQALSWTVACGYFHIHPEIKRAVAVLLMCAEEAEHPLGALSMELLCMLVAEINAQMILGM